jgi:hypothetical protein
MSVFSLRVMFCRAQVLRGEQTNRPISAGIGIHGSFPYGDTNHQCDKDLQNCKTPYSCPPNSSSVTLGDLPAGFGPNSATGGQTSQFSWAEGNDLKLFGCKGKSSTAGRGLLVHYLLAFSRAAFSLHHPLLTLRCAYRLAPTRPTGTGSQNMEIYDSYNIL